MAEKDITSLIKQFEDNYSDQLDAMDDYLDIYTLTAYKLDDESANVTSPEPRRFVDKVVQTAEAAKMVIKVTTPEAIGERGKDGVDADDTFEKNKDKESTIEHLAYGLINIADKNLRRDRVVYGRTVQSADIFYGALFGAMVHRVILQKKEGKIYTDILPVYPRHFSYGVDNNGMAWGAVRSWRDPDVVKAEYGLDVDDVTECIDFWDRDENIIQIGDEQFPQKHGLGKPPFIYRPVGSAPLLYTKDGKYDNCAYFGQGVLATSKDLYSIKNKLLTIWLSLIEKAHKPGYFLFTPGGKMNLEKLPWGTNQIMTLPLEARTEMIKPPDIAQTAPQLYNIIDREIQANDLSVIEYGIVAGSEYPSGKAMLALQAGKDSKITPILLALSAIYEDTIEMLIEQYSKTGIKTTFKGYDSANKLFYQEIKPSDVKKPWDIEVKFVAITPEQEVENISKAQMLLGMGLPDEYVYEYALQMQDPAKPIRQKYLKMLDEDPLILKKHQYEAAIREGQNDEAKKIKADIFKELQVLNQQQHAQQGGKFQQQQVTPDMVIPAQGEGELNESNMPQQSY